MSQYNPNKKIKIEIRQHIDPAKDYEIWDIRDKDRSRCIARNASEVDIEEVLTPSKYNEFRTGTGVFLVRAHFLMNQFSYMY